jgi:hypothetical protein
MYNYDVMQNILQFGGYIARLIFLYIVSLLKVVKLILW